jgi:hypothetical protein
MVSANRPAFVLERRGLFGKTLLHISAVPTQAFPMVRGTWGKINMINAVQKS